MGWTARSLLATVLRTMEQHRKEAGDHVRELRKARSWTIEHLAHEAGVATKTVSRLENGQTEARSSTLGRIAGALGVAESELLPAPGRPGAASQLDRIEAKVDDLRDHFGLTEAAERAG